MALDPLSSISGALGTLGGQSSTAPASSTGSSSAASSGSGPSWLQTETATIVTILLGLILIIAGLFQFKSVQTVTGYAAKGALAA